MNQPISFSVDPPARRQRLHLLIRFILLVAIGSIGLSGVYALLFLGLPAIVALILSQKGGRRYLDEDGPPIVRALRWVAQAYAYLWLLTDEVPGASTSVHLDIKLGGFPERRSALFRIVMSFPALLLAAVLTLLGAVLWVIAAFSILVNEEVPASISSYLEMMLRYRFRVFGYHLSITDVYPSLEAEPHAPVHQPG